MQVIAREQRVANGRQWPTRSNLNAISFVALLAAAILLGSGAIAVADCFGDSVQVHLAAAQQLPVQAPSTGGTATWHPPGGSGTASVFSGTLTSATLSVSGLSAGVRMLLAGRALVATITGVLVALALAYLCQRLRRGDPFIHALSVAVTATAWLLIIGGLAGQLLTGLGNFNAALEIAPDPASTIFTPTFTIAFWAPIAGIVLGVIGAAFRVGERMQHDTEGLV